MAPRPQFYVAPARPGLPRVRCVGQEQAVGGWGRRVCR